jgi:alpha-beta hydrolase superfamily lysophospholipase
MAKRYRDSNIFMIDYLRDLGDQQYVDEARCTLEAMDDQREPLGEALPEPIVFAGCLGWYHPGSARLGVVLCSPHGYEELCVHRHWRKLAQKLSDQDLPTLRFDYPGTGDSADDDEAPDRVRAWVEGIGNAVRTLRRVAGVEQVALVGMRMGAMLAMAAAEELDDVAALVLLAPIGSGETCFRELRALALMRAKPRHRHSATVSKTGQLEAAGFIYTPQTLADLRALPLLQSHRAPAKQILVLNRPNIAADESFRAQLAGCGAAVEEDVFVDYALVLRNPDLSVYPHQGFDRVVRWLAARREHRYEKPPAMTRLTVLRLPHAEEKPLFFSRRPDLFGVLCKPYGPARRAAVVFLNTGANHHIGTSRMTVTMARNLAKLGFHSLRLDIGGIGDSDSPPGRSGDVQNSVIDVSSALDGLKDRGYDEFILVGLCSGAKLALEATLQDKRIVGQILLNLQGFWKKLDADVDYMSRRAYFRMARRLSTWKRAARGEVDLWGITRSVFRRSGEEAAHNIKEVWGKICGTDSVRSAGLAQFRVLADRKVKTCFVYVEEDPGLDELEVVFGRSGNILGKVPNVSMIILNEGDHVFSWNRSRRQLYSVVEETLVTMTEAQPAQ